MALQKLSNASCISLPITSTNLDVHQQRLSPISLKSVSPLFKETNSFYILNKNIENNNVFKKKILVNLNLFESINKTNKSNFIIGTNVSDQTKNILNFECQETEGSNCLNLINKNIETNNFPLINKTFIENDIELFNDNKQINLNLFDTSKKLNNYTLLNYDNTELQQFLLLQFVDLPQQKIFLSNESINLNLNFETTLESKCSSIIDINNVKHSEDNLSIISDSYLTNLDVTNNFGEYTKFCSMVRNLLLK